MNIGILQCDDVAQDLRDIHGNYPDMFIALLRKVMPDLRFEIWRCHDGDIPTTTDGVDAWLITGSKYGANDPEPWIEQLSVFIRRVHEQQRPMVGVCFGHQLLAHALGGAVRTHPEGWGVGVSTNQVQEQEPWMQPWTPTLNILVSHQDQVSQLPAQSKVLASSDFCPFYMIQVDDTTLGIQGHPEFSKTYSADLMAKRRGRIRDDVLDQGLKSLESPVDDIRVAQWMLNFMAQTAMSPAKHHADCDNSPTAQSAKTHRS